MTESAGWSVIATRRMMSAVAAASCAAGGVIGILGAVLSPHDVGPRPLLGAVLALTAAVLFATCGTRCPRGVFYVLALLSTVEIGYRVWLQQGGSQTTAVAALVLVVTVYLFAFFDPVAAVLGEALVAGMLIVAKVWWDAYPWTSMVVLLGLNLLLAAVVGWLVRAAADADLDSLTGLLNHRGLSRALQNALSQAQEQEKSVTMIVADLDDFTEINRRYGRVEADRLLRAFGRAWREQVGSAPLARTRGDEFVAVLTEAPAGAALMPTDAVGTALTVEAAGQLVDAIRADPRAGRPRFCAGIVTSGPEDTPRRLFNRADTALCDAQRAGSNRTVVAPDTGADLRAMKTGLAAGEFRVVYQPIVDLGTGRLAGAEALLRWTRPGVGPVPPEHFITVAEETNFITTLGRWTLTQACVEAATWTLAVPTKITVNVSGPELQRPEYGDDVLQVLADTGLSAGRLVLEVTESTLHADSHTALETLERLRGHGIRVAIDDFGTGYSSLSRLQHLPADILKIDQSFVAPLRASDTSAPLIAAIAALAHAIGLRTVAEGVEEHHQAALLAHHECDEAQGWLYGRPGHPDPIRGALASQARALPPTTALTPSTSEGA
ncbi:EAL domain-containing protein [Cryptosporangium sp. NPDC051539]|uniref:EAL domain-containing protein n=1 Tax=Cryptosporangium sp. NPDC051539 TaxID=3363962 RepID=UPI003790F474